MNTPDDKVKPGHYVSIRFPKRNPDEQNVIFLVSNICVSIRFPKRNPDELVAFDVSNTAVAFQSASQSGTLMNSS